jgi:hypothetical protein
MKRASKRAPTVRLERDPGLAACGKIVRPGAISFSRVRDREAFIKADATARTLALQAIERSSFNTRGRCLSALYRNHARFA